MQDKAQFHIWVEQYAEQLYHYARSIVLLHEDADDCVQEAFLKAWKFYPSPLPKNEKAWLFAIVRNTAFDLLKKRKLFENERYAEKLQTDVYLDMEKVEIEFEQALGNCTELQQAIFRMRYYSAMPFKEIAAFLSKSENTVKVTYHQVEKYLKLEVVKQVE